MRLTDLNPCWIGAGGEGITNRDGSPVLERFGVGLSCDCPRCGAMHPMYIPFRNPLDNGLPVNNDSHSWERIGINFESISLVPSILRKDGCGWHGYITNGEIITV